MLELRGVRDFAKKAVVSNMFCTSINPLVSRHFFYEFLLFSFLTIAPSSSIPLIITSSCLSLTTCLLRVLLQLRLAGCSCRLLLRSKVEQQKSATKVSYVIGLRNFPPTFVYRWMVSLTASTVKRRYSLSMRNGFTHGSGLSAVTVKVQFCNYSLLPSYEW